MQDSGKDRNTSIYGFHFETNKAIKLDIADGKIESSTEIPESRKEFLPWLMPGLVDLQVNGFRGVDFNDPDVTAEDIEIASVKLLGNGITCYYPTLVTASPAKINRLLEVFMEVLENHPVSSKMIGGIHLEGPFISPEDGPRGAHRKSFCLLPDKELLNGWIDASGNTIRIITLAPELPGSLDLINYARSEDIIVSIGHTGAKPEQISDAADAGATLSTHLGNGAHRIMPRQHNYIWEQLAEDRLFATMIADGFHLPRSVLKVFSEVKKEKGILISDSMPFTGMEPGLYHSEITGDVVLTPEGKLHLAKNSSILAGSASTLFDGVKHMSSIIPFPEAWKMASINPLRLTQPGGGGAMEPGTPANLVSLDKSGDRMIISGVWLQGEQMFPK
jgi:N-acetylglucosamine-6-phosphate deacetylase